jgi:hypothetical protein
MTLLTRVNKNIYVMSNLLMLQVKSFISKISYKLVMSNKLSFISKIVISKFTNSNVI